MILPFIKSYIKLVETEFQRTSISNYLSARQKLWLGFCLTGILLTNTISWKGFERASFGGWSMSALSWMFRRTKINWNDLLQSSVEVLLKKYGITKGALLLDDTDRERSKNARQLFKLGKQKDKKSGGYFNGQSIVFLLLVSESICIPVGFRFYKTDPKMRLWRKQESQLKKKGVKKKHRQAAPVRDSAYPSLNQIAVDLVREFSTRFTKVKVTVILADALYGTTEFVEGVGHLYPLAQVISQIRKNQKIKTGGIRYDVTDYFTRRAPIRKGIVIRGGKKVTIYYSSVIAKVEAHGHKRLIIALKYEGETEFRFIIARNMTWRVKEVLECFSLRWLIEVFFQDWKMYQGWGQLTKHVGEDGSRRTLILSLLFDHCLLSHPTQAARIKDKLPLYTVGSLRNQLNVQSLLQTFEYILEQPDPKQLLQQLVQNVEKVYELRVSSKHLSGKKIQCLT